MKVFEDKLDILTTNETGIEQVELTTIKKVKSISPSFDINTDYENIRNKLLYAFERGIEILDNSTKLVKTDPCPRAIEAASTIFKTLNENSKELMQLHKNKNKILKELKETETSETNSAGNISDILKQENN